MKIKIQKRKMKWVSLVLAVVMLFSQTHFSAVYAAEKMTEAYAVKENGTKRKTGMSNKESEKETTEEEKEETKRKQEKGEEEAKREQEKIEGESKCEQEKPETETKHEQEKPEGETKCEQENTEDETKRETEIETKPEEEQKEEGEKETQTPEGVQEDSENVSGKEEKIEGNQETEETNLLSGEETEDEKKEEDTELIEELQSETEENKEQEDFKVFIEENPLFLCISKDNRYEYKAGEEAAFLLDIVGEKGDGNDLENPVAEVKVFPCEDLENAAKYANEEQSLFIDQESLPIHWTEDGFSFEMPESNVIILLDSFLETAALMEEKEEEDSEDAVPDKFKLICSQFPDYPQAPESMQTNRWLASTSRKKVIFYEKDGTKTTRVAYCLQPAVNSPGSGEIYETDMAVILGDNTEANRNLTKALYYLYGGPAWGKDITYKDGSSTVNLKNLLNNEGKDCKTEDQYYCVVHYILSYLYLGEDGKWNYMYTTQPEGPALNAHGISVVKKAVEEIKKLPSPITELSKTEVTAVYNREKGMSVSESITYHTWEENQGTMILPEGIFLVNETAGTRKSGTVVLNGGDLFHLEASSKITGTGNFEIKTTYSTDFTAMKLVKKGNHQDVGFSYSSGNKALHLKVTWPENGRVKLRKTDAETGRADHSSEKYTMEGAVYGIYIDADCEKKHSELTTGKDGTASQTLPAGEYCLKEIKAPIGYEIDPKIYKIQVRPSAEITVDVKEQPIKKKIKILKQQLKEEGQSGNSHYFSLQGAEYTIYKDESLQTTAAVLQTAEDGTAYSDFLRLGIYYIKETKAPQGYLLDPTVYKVDMNGSDTEEIYTVISGERVIRGSLSLMKYLDDPMEESVLQDLYASGKLEGIRFTLMHEEKEIEPVTIVTDRYGYAATKDRELVYGTWYLTEDPETTPEGYEGISDIKIEITEDGINKMYVVTNKSYQAYLCIQKKDKESGKLIVRNHAEFQILDSEGNAVLMPTFDGTAELFRTNERGEIHLTRPLKGGSYTLVERKAPDGYELAEPIEFQIQKNAAFQEPVILECEDVPKKGKIQITKIDEETGKHCGAGFMFEIRCKEDVLDGGGEIRKELLDGETLEWSAGTVVDRITTGENGIALSRDLYLGCYEIREIKAGEYYSVSTEVYPAVITEENAEAKESILVPLQIEDQKTRLEIHKEDAETGEGLSGVSFSFWEKEKEETMQTVKTDPAGYLRIEDLKQKTVYCVCEKETLPGYLRDETVYEIAVDENGRINGVPVYVMKIKNKKEEQETSIETESELKKIPPKTEIKTPPQNPGNSVETGDSTPIGLLLILAAGSLIICMAEIGCSKSKKKGKLK